MDVERLIELVRRVPVLEALQKERTMDRRELERHLDVSKSTVHRFTQSLRESGLVERANDGFVLTPLGEVCAEEIISFRSSIETAWKLEPILSTANTHRVDIDIDAFTDATVTTAEPGNPYRPVNRFMSLVSETDTLRSLDPASINPLQLDDLHERIVEGMEADIIFPPAVVEELLTANPQRARTAFESGNLTLRIHDDLPFGLTLCDNRIGIGVYDDTVGILRTYADTDDPAAYKWANRIYAEYCVESTAVSNHPKYAHLPPVQSLCDDN